RGLHRAQQEVLSPRAGRLGLPPRPPARLGSERCPCRRAASPRPPSVRGPAVFIFDLLRQSAEAHPDKPAGIFPTAQLAFGELARRSGRVAAALHARGIGAGDRVAILCDNGPEPVVAFWGIREAGAQTVDMPTLAGRDVLQAVL